MNQEKSASSGLTQHHTRAQGLQVRAASVQRKSVHQSGYNSTPSSTQIGAHSPPQLELLCSIGIVQPYVQSRRQSLVLVVVVGGAFGKER